MAMTAGVATTGRACNCVDGMTGGGQIGRTADARTAVDDSAAAADDDVGVTAVDSDCDTAAVDNTGSDGGGRQTGGGGSGWWFFFLPFVCFGFLQCFDAVGWASGRASGL